MDFKKNLCSSSLSRPAPKPMPPTIAQGLITWCLFQHFPSFLSFQGLIAALTLAHTGIIAYALHKEQQEETFKFIGESDWKDLNPTMIFSSQIIMFVSWSSQIRLTWFQKLEFETTAAVVESRLPPQMQQMFKALVLLTLDPLLGLWRRTSSQILSWPAQPQRDS